jgi:hypothetical protein
MIVTHLTPPPTPMYLNLPSRKLRLDNLDVLKMAWQLTIMESHMYQWIKPVEIMRRLWEETRAHPDSITAITQCSDKVSALRPSTHTFTMMIVVGELGSGFYIARRVSACSGCSNKESHQSRRCMCFCGR